MLYDENLIFDRTTPLAKSMKSPWTPLKIGEMARPKKDIEARVFVIQARVTADELVRLRDLASTFEVSMSDFIRLKLLASKPRRRRLSPELGVLIRALGTIGNIRADLNQILKDRWAHRYVRPSQIESIFDSLSKISNAIHDNLRDNGD